VFVEVLYLVVLAPRIIKVVQTLENKRRDMRIIDVYFALFGLTNIALIHLAFCMDNMKSKCVFYAVACVVTSRMSLDMYIYANTNYSAAFGPGLLSMALIETVLLRFVIHRMKKYASSPPVILLVTTLAATALDTCYIYWHHHNNTLYRHTMD